MNGGGLRGLHRLAAAPTRWFVVVAMLLLAAPCWAQDGGVWVYERAALLLPTGAIVTVDAGVALDGPVALERANELNRLRAAPPAPTWLTAAAAVVASVVYAADQIRRWVQPP